MTAAFETKKLTLLEGSVGRAVVSKSRGPWFESSHQQKFMRNIYCQLCWKDENKEKEAGNGAFSITIVTCVTLWRSKYFSQNFDVWHLMIWHFDQFSLFIINKSVLHTVNFFWFGNVFMSSVAKIVLQNIVIFLDPQTA